MAYLLSTEITINEIVFSRINSIKIESSEGNISDTAIIKMPTTAHLQKVDQTKTDVEVAKVFKAGDKVQIKTGYGTPELVFEGHVKQINLTTPLEIICEDSIYLLRKKSIRKSWKNTTLKEIINYVLAGTGVSVEGSVPEINFTKFYLKDVNAAFALQKLSDEYGLTVYFVSREKLFVGFIDNISQGEVRYNIGDIDNENYSNIIKPELKYRNADDVKLKIKAVHIQKNNTRTEVEVGDDDGELRTLYFYDIESKAELKKQAIEEIQKYKFSGYQGTLKTFLKPKVKHGMIANVYDGIYPERSGKYRVKKVVTTVGSGGGKLSVELGLKV